MERLGRQIAHIALQILKKEEEILKVWNAPSKLQHDMFWILILKGKKLLILFYNIRRTDMLCHVS
jgi:hypothetical protein